MKSLIFLFALALIFISCNHSKSKEIVELSQRCDTLEMRIENLLDLVEQLSENQTAFHNQTIELNKKTVQLLTGIVAVNDAQNRSISLLTSKSYY